MSPVFPNSIEVFDLAENQDMLSPVELDPEKLAHKFKEVYVIWIIWILKLFFICSVSVLQFLIRHLLFLGAGGGCCHLCFYSLSIFLL